MFCSSDNVRSVIQHSEAVVQMCSVKKVFLKISQKSQKIPVPESLF